MMKAIGSSGDIAHTVRHGLVDANFGRGLAPSVKLWFQQYFFIKAGDFKGTLMRAT